MRRNDGFILVITLLIVVALAILVFGTMFTTMIDRTVSANQQGASVSRYVALAGIQHAKTMIFRHLHEYFADEGSGWCTSPIAGGFSYGGIQLDPNDPAARSTPWIDFGPGRYRVTLDLTDTYLVMTSVGRAGRSQATAQLVATSGGGPSTAWDNAIFAEGTDPAAKAITGNVAVYGSVHIVIGEFAVEDNLFEDISVTGTAGIYNSYAGKGGANSDIRDTLRAVTGDGDVDLCTRVKIERGDVYLDSNASRLGVAGDELYSVHLGEGRVFSGRRNANPRPIDDHHDSDRINLRYPTVGVNSGYQGFELKLPRLAPDYPADVPAIDVTAPQCAWLVRDGAVRLPPAPDQVATNQSCASGGNLVEWIADPGGTDAPGYLRFSRTDGADAPATINTGELDVIITGPLRYEGQGVIRSGACQAENPSSVVRDGEQIPVCRPDPARSADITVEGSFLPRSDEYPVRDVLGLVTTGDMHLGVQAQTTIAALAYAAGRVVTDKQTLIVGALVASRFDIGNQVPKVAWHREVPEAASFLGMPGAPSWQGPGSGGFAGDNLGVLRDISIEWREGLVD